MSMNFTLAQAIKNKSMIELRYHGYARSVEPYAYGQDKTGDEVLRCYQVAGGSVSGESAGWKLLKLREVISLDSTSSKL
jgi:hypothetical protein